MASSPHSIEVRTPGDSPQPTAVLLSPSVVHPSLLLLLNMALAAAMAFVLLHPPLTVVTVTSAATWALSKLPKPVVLLISLDGFRFGYRYKVPLPRIRRLIACAGTGILIISSCG
ncbi:unnamed protein product [Miscanthus lutarioriparius]|uniref:Uncharacterized protein n=1 Tax=Miscanthus lutarioriparius TaxID=422564 RepID=A0A811MN33_9POAL|nr:unnamed protein product [Miscanthus lutarioriparius]